MSTSDPMATNPDALVIPGRECGTCTLCCKVYNIPEINKPAGKWCKHCLPGKGCSIHDKLPHQCATFNCRWRTEEAMLPHWKPELSKMVVTVHPRNGYIYIRVDPGTPSAWRRQPYYDELRQLARNNLESGIYVVIFVNDAVTLVLPDLDIPLTTKGPIDRISVRKRFGAGGAAYDVTLDPPHSGSAEAVAASVPQSGGGTISAGR
jgi:hypothetical protein